MNSKSTLLLLSMGLTLSACATMESPRNLSGSTYAAQQLGAASDPQIPSCRTAMTPPETSRLKFVAADTLTRHADTLAAGDRLRLTISGDKDQLTGSYVISADGSMQLPGQNLRFQAAGKTIAGLEAEIEQQLFARQLVRRISNGVRLSQVELGGVSVSVSGAVFDVGTVRVGERQAEVRDLNLSSGVSGDMNVGRTVATALRAAGGVRPDADPGAIYLVRGEVWTRLDLSGAIDGSADNDLQVTSGDRIIVASVGCLQDHMVRPSAITTPGIRIFISNLTRPAASNASSAIGKDSTSLPYGTRFLQGLVAANCVGGSAMNSGRSAVLISRNPVTGRSNVISRSIEGLVREADRDAHDPYLMPGDSIACYDSAAMNLRDVISTVSDTITPFVLFKNVD